MKVSHLLQCSKCRLKIQDKAHVVHGRILCDRCHKPTCSCCAPRRTKIRRPKKQIDSECAY